MALVEKLYLDVVTRANKAKEELESLRKAARKAQEPLTDEINKLKTRLQLRESYLKKTKEEQKQLRELLKIEGRRILNSKEALKTQEKIVKLNDKIVAQNKEIENSKKITDARKDLEQEQKRQKILGEFNERRKAEQRDYTDFVKRSSMESGRFSDRLDKRDRTRSLRENLRRGMEKGTAISERYHAEENAIYKLERSLGIASTAFDRVRHPAERLTDAFYTFQRIAYAAQAALGVLAGTIGDLVVGMMGLVGVAGAAAGSLIAVAGAMANLGAGMMTAKFALSGVGAAVQQLWSGQNQYNRALRDAKKAFRDLRFEAEDAALSEQEAAIALEKAREALARVQDLPADSRARREAELEFQRAELNYRRAKARVKDTNDALKKGPNANVDRSQDPLNNLTKSQIAFAKYLVTLKPVIQELKEAAASSFLPPLQKAIDVVVKNVFPTLKAGLNDIGGALGDASRNFTDAFKDRENIELFRDFLANSKPTLRILGAVAANAFGGILAILKAAQPITDRFARWIFTVSERFDQLGKGAGQDNLRKFFKLAGDVASELGTAFKLVFGGLKNIVEATFPNGANSGAGGVILQWLKEIGAGFKLFTGQEGFSTFLKNATENAKAALGTLGSFLNIFIELAANPANKEFWMVIQGAVPFVKKILEDGQKAGPAFGKLIVAVTELISRFSDSAALESFFTTLQLLLNTLSNFVRAIAPILHAMGALHGVFLAIVTVGIMLRKTIQIIMGIMMKLLRVGGSASTAFENFRSKLVAAQEMGAKGFKGTLEALREMRLEMTNLKRIELLTDIAKGNKKRQIDELRSKMALLNRTTKAGRKEFEDLKLEIAKVEGSYKRLKVELAASGKQAKTWGELTAKSAESARFGLDKVAASQERVARSGRFLRGGAGLAIGGGALASAVTSGTAGGGIGGALSTIGGAAMFAPNPIIMGIGAVASISGAIISGFDQANQEAAAAKEQKRIEIKARLVELQADSLNEKRTALGALVGKGQDIAGANKTLNKIKTAASTSLNNLKDSQGTNTDALVSGLLTSNVLADAVISSKSRDAIIKAATTAAASGIYSTTDASTGATTINYDALQSALEAAFTGEDGQGKGLAGIKAFQSRVSKTRLTTTGAAVETNAAIAIETAKQNAVTLAPTITKLQDILSAIVGPNGQTEYTGGNPFEMATTPMKIERAKDFGISVEKLESLTRAELLATIRQKITDLTAETNAKTVTVKPTINPITNQEKLFRDAMANIGKPKKLPDPLPTPTTSFYKNSMTNGQTQITLLSDIKTALTTSKQTIELKDATGKVVSTYTVENGVNG
jgi:hypothetical protein